MIIIGSFGSLIFYLQAIKIFYEHSAASVSLFAFIVGFVSVASWTIYGFILKNRVLIFSNALGTIGALLTVIGILIYQN